MLGPARDAGERKPDPRRGGGERRVDPHKGNAYRVAGRLREPLAAPEFDGQRQADRGNVWQADDAEPAVDAVPTESVPKLKLPPVRPTLPSTVAELAAPGPVANRYWVPLSPLMVASSLAFGARLPTQSAPRFHCPPFGPAQLFADTLAPPAAHEIVCHNVNGCATCSLIDGVLHTFARGGLVMLPQEEPHARRPPAGRLAGHTY